MIRHHLPPALRPWCALLVLAAAMPAVAQPGLRTGEQVYKETCIACHETGVARAPRIGDKAAWAPLIEEGQPMLTGHAWVGVRAMPPKGGNPDLSLVEFAGGVAYMANRSGADWKAPDASMTSRILREAERRLDLSIREAEAMKRDLQRQRKALR